MSQTDTYRPAMLPSEAVMMPAMDEFSDAPPPSVQGELGPDDPAMRPAQRHSGSYSLERLRNRTRLPDNLQWISTTNQPLATATNNQQTAQYAMPEAARRRPSTLSQGAALQTLMQSAARGQHAPPQMLSEQSPAMRMTSPPFEAPQMRGALRQAVRNAQQPQTAGHPNMVWPG